MPRPIVIPTLAALVFLIVAAPVAYAQTAPPEAPPGDMPPPDQDGHRHREPPPQAYDACNGKKSGDTVQFQGRRGMMEATCTDSPKGLFARPNRPPPGGPPPQ